VVGTVARVGCDTDLLTTASRNVLVSDNDVKGAVAGIYATTAQSLVDSVITDTTTTDNRGNGISRFAVHGISSESGWSSLRCSGGRAAERLTRGRWRD
jgi:hypothetical protein